MNSSPPETYSFPTYLSAKISVDQRALNRPVWHTLAHALPPAVRGHPLQVLEVGGGIGALLQRMLDWNLFTCADYLGLDALPENIAFARRSVQVWAQDHGWQVHSLAQGLQLTRAEACVTVRFEVGDLFDFIAARSRQPAAPGFDLLAAHAFLDLLDIPAALPPLLSLLRPGGLFYFPINFDGVTLFEPLIDPELDEVLVTAYHRSMDQRLTAGRPSGDSRAGRHLFHHLSCCAAAILAAGSSDWVVFAQQGVYPAREAYFLYFILHFFETTLAGVPGLDPARLASWLAQRRAQVQRGELVYIAHQIDFCGRVGSVAPPALPGIQ